MSQVRESYDIVADEYTRRIYGELEGKPLDGELLRRFTRNIPDGGTVCDLGCGPGHVTRYLKDCGASVIGADLSEGMLEQARRLNPDIEFFRKDMLALDVPEGAWAGIVAFYSIVNFAPETLPRVFSEMRRSLRPGGNLLLAFHRGEGCAHMEEWWDRKVSIDFFFFETERVATLLREAGFQIDEVIERDPYPEIEHPSQRAYLYCRYLAPFDARILEIAENRLSAFR